MSINLPDNQNELQQIDNSNLSVREKYIALKYLLERACKELTSNESLQFPSLFSRLVFIAQKYDIPRQLERQLQRIRVKAIFLQKDKNNVVSNSQYLKAKGALDAFFIALSGDDTDVVFVMDEDTSDREELSFDKIRVQVLDIDTDNSILTCRADVLFDEDLKIKYAVPNVNDVFNPTIARLWIGAQLNLIDVRHDDVGFYIPSAFVLEPDYLIDASAMAECFQQYGNSHLHYFRRKFEQPVNSHYILLGNLANFFLDELIYAEDINSLEFKDTFIRSFRAMPFEYASCCDIASKDAFVDFMHRAQVQFGNIKRVVKNDFPANGLDTDRCILEPSFFSEKYGFQGRLDLLQIASDNTDFDRIIELKSGKPPYPREDMTRIAPNHEVQTAVYRLMIQGVFGKDARHIYPTILYSSAEGVGENLRLAAPYRQLEKEILNIRNLIVITEHDLYTGDSNTVRLTFEELFDIRNYGRVPDFFVGRLNDLMNVLDKTTPLEKDYFYRYITFVSRELYLLKVGDEGYNTSMSVSALWNTTFEDRKNSLDLLDGLQIEEIDTEGRDMKIRFRRKAASSDCVNFREGEMCILYPCQTGSDTMLTNQILKGNIVEISAGHILLRFRYKQRNKTFFDGYRYWVVEHDRLDHSYNAMFKSLFAFFTAPKEIRNLLLGLRQPASSFKNKETGEVLGIKQKQDEVIEKALSSKDYFLIVGPPGTGKTSIFARRLIEQLYLNPDNNILVMAYTNRAVDELCESICSAFACRSTECDKYIRIGTELSCAEAYRHRLLQNISQDVKSRKELIDLLDRKRIFVGTLASIVGKPELFDIKQFDVAIIDEASQILEPQIIGLLSKFGRFIMIGDHKQLSTITLQGEDKSVVDNPELNNIGLYDCRESLFERLYRICQKNGWTHAYDTLTYHGRMHADLSAFVNIHFYDSQLKIATARQEAKLAYTIYDKYNPIQQLIATQRLAFIPCHQVLDNINFAGKINEAEADIIVNLTKNLLELYKINNLNFDPLKTLGIISPYRNQIALIKQRLEKAGIDAQEIMIDTVERFQGSQRDVILVSFCFNSPYQLKYFANMDREGRVDRKLNVALTRAREQLFLVGNDLIMRQNPVYQKLLEYLNK